MNKTDCIQKTVDYIREKFTGEGSGHDWWHVYRVWRMAVRLAEAEGGDLFVVQLGALLHDIADWKFHDGDESVGPYMAREWLLSLEVDEEVIQHVEDIIRDISFKGANVVTQMKSLEGEIVQDADRLDAIGAVGIGRTFAYGGHKNHPMYDPELQYKIHNSFEEYKTGKGSTINHFYEKLLLLKERMNTETAKAIAKSRHKYMEMFLQEFYLEWEGKDCIL
jgi:uncharacterized protein